MLSTALLVKWNENESHRVEHKSPMSRWVDHSFKMSLRRFLISKLLQEFHQELGDELDSFFFTSAPSLRLVFRLLFVDGFKHLKSIKEVFEYANSFLKLFFIVLLLLYCSKALPHEYRFDALKCLLSSMFSSVVSVNSTIASNTFKI